jgi:hypothetical protein
MKQLEQWGERGEAQKATQSAQPARRTPLCRVVLLHEWQNASTGETCRQTTQEFAQSKGVSFARSANLIRKKRACKVTGWSHKAQLHKVIQGDAIEWFTVRHVKNGSKSIQRKEEPGAAWGKSLIILSLYARGMGIKAIAKHLNFSPGPILKLLVEMGVNTSARKNHGSRNAGSLRTFTGQKRIYDAKMKTTSGRLKKRVMGRIWSAMKRQRINSSGTFALVGCSADDLRRHIENQFQPGMSFENYGEWHVDHIRPCASFDLSKADQMSECFNWRNLQPLWAFENISKGAKYA